ncbi:hypothetical protein EZS27_000403 [termite gut metagenome]|uniref:Tetratricopeptide repeat protein n=1 Tax=termite gut metagenome TaxID=433724 RepID=A0A5J4T3G4_9ZZZZ
MKVFTSVIIPIILLTSCRTMESFPIDYMVPASVTFPSQLRRVAIVNNVSKSPGDNFLISKKTTSNEKEKITFGNVALVTESFAKHIAATNYFDEVLICDSALRAYDTIPRKSILSKKEVNELTDNFNVDALFSLENLQIKSVNAVEYIPDIQNHYETLDVTVYTTVSVYLPQRSTPMATITASDSIFWARIKYGWVLSTLAIFDEQIMKEVIDFTGSIPVKYLIPGWKTVDRYIYINGSTEMRDATVCVHKNEWDKAYELWKQANLSKKKKLQMYSALNIAVYHEINDNIEEAITWATKAKELAQRIEKAKESFPQEKVTNSFLFSVYIDNLKIRKADLSILNAQMQRLKEDF